MDTEYRDRLWFAVGDGRFNAHVLDWGRFYDFIIAVHRGPRNRRPLESEVEAVLSEAMPHATEWNAELLAAYRVGLDLLDHVNN